MRAAAQGDYRLIDSDQLAKNWSYNLAGTLVPAEKSLIVFGALKDAINHLCAYSPRVIFAQRNYDTLLTAITSDPIARWYYSDTWRNGSYIVIDIVAGCYGADAEISLDGSSSSVATITKYTSSGSWQNHLTMIATNGYTGYPKGQRLELTQTIPGGLGSTQIYSVQVAEIPATVLDSLFNHKGVYGIIKADTPVLARDIEEARQALHDLYSGCCPHVFSWSSVLESAVPTTQSAGRSGICITSTTDLNIMDLVSTTRSATTPGIWVPAYGCGRGNSNEITMAVAAYARVGTNGYSGTITVEGPSDSDTMDISSDEYVWNEARITLDTSQDWDAATIGLNKVDLFGRIDASATRMQISAISAWLEWG